MAIKKNVLAESGSTVQTEGILSGDMTVEEVVIAL